VVISNLSSNTVSHAGSQTWPVNSHDCKNCDHPKTLVSGSDVYVAYSQATNHFISVSTDAGRSFTETDVLRQGVVGFSEGGVVGGSPINHMNGWNVWYRTSADGGATWTTPGSGCPQTCRPSPSPGRRGFLFPYGDYMRIELNPNCGDKPVMAWGGWRQAGDGLGGGPRLGGRPIGPRAYQLPMPLLDRPERNRTRTAAVRMLFGLAPAAGSIAAAGIRRE